MTQQLVHGGQLQAIAQHYEIPLDKWLDLSTGIAPRGYPVDKLPAQCWHRLPEPNHALLKAAQDYYACDYLLPIAGSQSVIQLLPRLCHEQRLATNTVTSSKTSRVWLPKVGYKEHQKAWQQADYKLHLYTNINELNAVAQGDIVVIINPNNPSGELLDYQHISALYHELKAKQVLLIVDEAFMDANPQHSLLSALPCEQLIILRSVGKFFGLAGIRLGFVAATPKWLTLFEQALGPWSINGPAQYVGAQALADKTWQLAQLNNLSTWSNALEQLLSATFNRKIKGTVLFKTVLHPNAPDLFKALCQQGIYVRLCDEQNALRFGIPDEQGLSRLAQALASGSVQVLI